MRNAKFSIEAWQPGKSAVTGKTRPIPDGWSPRLIGVVGTLIVHALVFKTAVLGSHMHKFRLPEIQGMGATLIKSAAPPSESLILLDLPTASMSDQPLAEELASIGPGAKATVVVVLSDDPLPHVDIPKQEVTDDKNAAVAVDSGDPAAQAAMFVRYTGQIDARIERVWRRPRSPVNPSVALAVNSPDGDSASDVFKCQVRIIQDAHGNVNEVQLIDCNGTVAWQHSLIMAILASSPLPAPPTPSVFTRSLTMTFTATSYRSGIAADDYELPTTLTADRK